MVIGGWRVAGDRAGQLLGPRLIRCLLKRRHTLRHRLLRAAAPLELAMHLLCCRGRPAPTMGQAWRQVFAHN